MPLSEYAANAVLNKICNNTDFTTPSVWYIGLTLSVPSATSFTEISGNGYARMAIGFSAAASSANTNDAAATFAASSGAWGWVKGWGLFDALSGGNRLMQDELDEYKLIGSGDVFEFAIGAVDNTFA